jgi:hypothetical protein
MRSWMKSAAIGPAMGAGHLGRCGITIIAVSTQPQRLRLSGNWRYCAATVWCRILGSTSLP